MNIYVASSWRNSEQPNAVKMLRNMGHVVYDFKNPKPGEHGFSWAEIDVDWQSWSVLQWKIALEHPIAERGYAADFAAMNRCDVMVLVLPCGRSAHLELGWAVGVGKPTAIFTLEDFTEPELMVKMCGHIATSYDDLAAWLRDLKSGDGYNCNCISCVGI